MKVAGDAFCEFRGRSFYINGQVVCSCLVLFIRFLRCGWISLTIGEGIIEWSSLEEDPDLLELEDVDDEFAYPVISLYQLRSYLGREVLGVFEYRLEKANNICVGVYFKCKGDGFSVVEEDGCLCFFDGVVAKGFEGLVLVDA